MEGQVIETNVANLKNADEDLGYLSVILLDTRRNEKA
jgi:hypothetical protein